MDHCLSSYGRGAVPVLAEEGFATAEIFARVDVGEVARERRRESFDAVWIFGAVPCEQGVRLMLASSWEGVDGFLVYFVDETVPSTIEAR